MPMIRAIRMLNAIEAGTTTGAQLQALLADPGRLAEFSVLCAMRGQAYRMASAVTTMNAIAQSPLARAAVGSSSRDAGFAVMSQSSMAIGKLIAGHAGLAPAAYADAAAVAASAPAMVAVCASESAVLLLAASSVATTEVDYSAAARGNFYGAPCGGGYLGVIQNAAGARYAVIQAPKATGDSAPIAWKSANTDSPGTLDNDDGLANANAQNNASHPLFAWARSLAIGGFNDWAPPAYNVLMAIVAKHSRAENALFKAGGSQVYEDVPYWSATQHPGGPSNAWYSSFSDGSTLTITKDRTYRARVVRRIKL